MDLDKHRIDAHCKNEACLVDGPCHRDRTVLEDKRKAFAGRGRPMGHLLAWLLAGQVKSFTTREEHQAYKKLWDLMLVWRRGKLLASLVNDILS